jgi:hypothetical protein
MIDWLVKTVEDFGKLAKNVANTPAPIGKTITGVLVTEGLIIGVFLLTHKVKIITVLG